MRHVSFPAIVYSSRLLCDIVVLQVTHNAQTKLVAGKTVYKLVKIPSYPQAKSSVFICHLCLEPPMDCCIQVQRQSVSASGILPWYQKQQTGTSSNSFLMQQQPQQLVKPLLNSDLIDFSMFINPWFMCTLPVTPPKFLLTNRKGNKAVITARCCCRALLHNLEESVKHCRSCGQHMRQFQSLRKYLLCNL